MIIEVVSYFIFSSDLQHGSAGTSPRACPAVRALEMLVYKRSLGSI